jgi:integrase
MSESLNRKLRTTDKPKRKVALYRKELLAVLDYLDDRPTLKNMQTKALILTMVTTGLRAAEVVSLTADSLEYDSDCGAWYLNGLGKGSKPFRVELHDSAHEAIKAAFFAQFGRDFRGSDHLFYSTESYRGKKPTPMKTNTMYVRLRDLGARLKTLGLIRQNVEFSAHLFRRTFLTQLARGGMDVASLQQAGRHSSFDTTLKHYLDAQGNVSPFVDKMLDRGAA